MRVSREPRRGRGRRADEAMRHAAEVKRIRRANRRRLRRMVLSTP